MNNIYKNILFNIKKSRNISFFCGSGISFNSGIPTVEPIIKTIIKSLSNDENLSDYYYARFKGTELPFESFMQIIIENSKDEQILEIFERGKPNNNHKFIAKLCILKRVRDVYTTNFDTLLEKAFEEAGLKKDKDFIVLDNEKSFRNECISKKGANTIRLFKIHGNIAKYDTIRTTLETISKEYWLKERSKIIKNAFYYKLPRIMIVMGYSFSDAIDINPIIESINIKSKQINYIIYHSKSSICDFKDISFPKIKIENNLQAKININNLTGNIIHIKTESFIENLMGVLKIKLVCINKNKDIYNLVWKNKIEKWTNRLLPSVRELILSKLFFLIDDVKSALLWNDLALAKAQYLNLNLNEVNILLDRISILSRKGEESDIIKAKQYCNDVFRKSITLRYFKGISKTLDLTASLNLKNSDNFLKAQKQYLSILKINEKIPDMRMLAKTWLSLSSCFRHEQEFSNAIEACQKSIKIRKEIGDIKGLCKCFQGLGNIYLDMKKYEEAIIKYREFEKITCMVGDIWGKATANYSLATVYYCIGGLEHLRKAKKCCEDSLEIRIRNKNREYINCIYLKAKILYQLGSIKEAKKLHKEALEYRQRMDNKSDLADSLSDIGFMELDENNYIDGFKKIIDAINIFKDKKYQNKLNDMKIKLRAYIQIAEKSEIITINKLICNIKGK